MNSEVNDIILRSGLLGERLCNLCTCMKFGTQIDFGLLNSNLPGAKTGSQWGRHIGQFKMAATEKHIFPISSQQEVIDYQKSTFPWF